MQNYARQVLLNPVLGKEENIYDDWVYIGKEAYGSRVVKRNSLKPGAKLFDALGRTYDKMKAYLKYYVFKDAVEREERQVPLEFEVYGRLIKDAEGNDIQAFIKEDKAHGLRRDSSFYWDGSWEVLERDERAKAIRSWTSLGVKTENQYDNQWRVTNKTMTYKNNDTISVEQYIWKNGRLVKTIFNGTERIFIYGKTLQDTVRVIPSDEWIGFHLGYNNTVGKIPSENDTMYKYFIKNPYSPILFRFDEEKNESLVASFVFKNSVAENFGKLNILGRIDASGCVTKAFGMPEAQCRRLEAEKDFLDNTANRRQGRYGYPGKQDTLHYGSATIQLDLKLYCECNADGRYQSSFDGSTINESILIMQSTWKYDDIERKWHERCWYGNDLQKTYEHEIQHIRNGREMANFLIKFAMAKSNNTERECARQANEEADWLIDKWDIWYELEQRHENNSPKSPNKYSGSRYDYPCN